MCSQCEKLLNIQNNAKAVVTLKDGMAIDATEDKWIMEVNHETDGTPYAFIAHHLSIESTERCYNTSISIKNCPFCGEKLAD